MKVFTEKDLLNRSRITKVANLATLSFNGKILPFACNLENVLHWKP